MIHYKENDLWNIPFCSPGWMPTHGAEGEITPHVDQVTCPDCLERMAAKTARALEQDAQDTLPRATFLRYEYQPSTNAAAAEELGRGLK